MIQDLIFFPILFSISDTEDDERIVTLDTIFTKLVQIHWH